MRSPEGLYTVLYMLATLSFIVGRLNQSESCILDIDIYDFRVNYNLTMKRVPRPYLQTDPCLEILKYYSNKSCRNPCQWDHL